MQQTNKPNYRMLVKMKGSLIVFVLLVGISFVLSLQKCPSGAKIYEWGISAQGKKTIVNAHNKYRRMILKGQVKDQPRGKHIQMMSYDEKLGKQGRKVSKLCEMDHVKASDKRWRWIGQNLYISWSSVNTPGQDWEKAAAGWFNEHKSFQYPFRSKGGKIGHYTQMVWHNSNKIGCDFIKFYDVTAPQWPYAKLYTCNYGPGGNIRGQIPYLKAKA